MKIKLLILFQFFILSCSSNNDLEPFVFKYKDIIVSLEEFLLRSEYNERPLFCSSNSELHKNIILKNFILEKILSYNAKTNNVALTPNQEQFIQGRKEQKMREIALYQNGYTDQAIQNNDLREKIDLAFTIYECSVLKFNTNESRNKVLEEWRKGILNEDKYSNIIRHKKKIKWNEYENKSILDSFYVGKREKNDIIGPFTSNKKFVYFKIENMIYLNIEDENQIDFIKKRITKTNVSDVSHKNEFISKIIQINEKDLKFNSSGFIELLNFFGKNLKMDNNKIIDLNSQFNNILVTEIKSSEINRNNILLWVKNKEWTIGKVLKSIKTYPLIFKEHKILRKKFPEKLKFSIIDLVLSVHFNEFAINQRVDRNDEVLQEVKTWTQFFLAQNYLKNKFPNSKSSDIWLKNQNFQETLNLMIEKNIKYIDINWDLFNGLKITDIPFNALSIDNPYPNILPKILPISNSDLDSLLLNQL